MHLASRTVFRFNLCLLNLIGVALFFVAAYDLRLSTHLGAAISEFSGIALVVAIVGIGCGAYKLALRAQCIALVGPVVMLQEVLSAPSQNVAGSRFLITFALGLIGYFTLLALAVGLLARQPKD